MNNQTNFNLINHLSNNYCWCQLCNTWHFKYKKKKKSKLKEIDGEYFRMRNGKLVKIPDEWVGKVTHKQTMRKRKSYKKNLKRKSGK